MINNGIKLTRTQLDDIIAITTSGLRPDQVALAIQIMTNDGDNVAHFGINGCYLFSEFDSSEGGLQ